jgi:hypothetical protein
MTPAHDVARSLLVLFASLDWETILRHRQRRAGDKQRGNHRETSYGSHCCPFSLRKSKARGLHRLISNFWWRLFEIAFGSFCSLRRTCSGSPAVHMML